MGCYWSKYRTWSQRQAGAQRDVGSEREAVAKGRPRETVWGEGRLEPLVMGGYFIALR